MTEEQKFNQRLYEASLKALKDNGVPWEIADPASAVGARDDGSKPNFGRTPQDQEVVHEAVRYLNLHWNKEE